MMTLRSAFDAFDDIATVAKGGRLVVVLDYDGTLSPIADRPERAVLDDAARAVLADLAARVPVLVVSGRGLSDVRARVGLDQLVYAGCHGFEIEGPGLKFDPRSGGARATAAR